MMTTEQFIVDSAARGLSRRAVRQALGISYVSFVAILEVMPPIEWPARGCSVDSRRASGENIRKLSRDAQLAGSIAHREKHMRTLPDGRKGSVKEFVALYGIVSQSTVRRRLRDGWELVAALTTPNKVRKFDELHQFKKSEG